LIQFATPRRTGWLTAVVFPTILAAYSALAVLPGIPGFSPNLGMLLLGLVMALGAGFLFDGASLQPQLDQARRSPWPLFLWGIGMFMYMAAPAWTPATQTAIERWAGALGLVGTSALAGQALGWVRRLTRRQGIPSAVAPNAFLAGWRRLGSFAGGAAIATLACWVVFPTVTAPSHAKQHNPSHQKETPSLNSGAGNKRAPANSLLVFTRIDGKKPRLFVLDLNSGRYKPLAMERAGAARWSPDGTRLAFDQWEGDFTNFWVAQADGSDLRLLTKLPGFTTNTLIWSADGKQLFFPFSKGSPFAPAALWVIPVGGGNAEEVLAKSESVTFASLSPDGRTLAYCHDTPPVNLVASPRQIKLLDLATRKSSLLIRLPNPGWYVTGLTWGPEGKALLAATQADFNGPYQLMRIPMVHPELQPLGSSFPNRPSSLTMLQDGSLALVAGFPTVKGAPEKREIWRIDLAKGNRRVLETDGSVVPYVLHVSPRDNLPK
jgi:dipeptidyl aminopeptidase/acylaminoacyl peptidase